MPSSRLLPTAFLLLAVCYAASPAFAEKTTFTLTCVASDIPTPVSVEYIPEEGQDVTRLGVSEVVLSATPSLSTSTIPAQWDLSGGARLWWILPPGPAGIRTFRLVELDEPASTPFTMESEPETQPGWQRRSYTLKENDIPILRYNFGDIPMPPGREPHHFADGRPYGGPRSDYIHPLYGFEGEEITEDYPEHPHHRGVWWSWPVVRWGERTADIWAVCDVWARPRLIGDLNIGPVFVLLQAQNKWRFGAEEQHPIMGETVLIRVFASTVTKEGNRQRLIDVDVSLCAHEEDVAIGGRPGGGYGGFALRALPAENQTITPFVEDPEEVDDRSPRAWCDYAADFSGSKKRTSFVLLQHKDNPGFPTEHLIYPNLNCFMPAFPGDQEYAVDTLENADPLNLRHRILLQEGTPMQQSLEQAWDAYNQTH